MIRATRELRFVLAAVTLGVVSCLGPLRPVVAEVDRARPIPLRSGLPKASGVDALVIVTDFPKKDPRYKTIKAYAKAESAKLIWQKEASLEDLVRPLRKAGAAYVAFAYLPTTIDTNLHYGILELSRDLDADPMPDFHFGYLTARDGPGLERLVASIRKRDKRGASTGPTIKPRASVVALRGNGSNLSKLDFILHYGHGQAWRVDGGMTGEQVGALELDHGPVIWSGACFNGVFSRSFHKCAYQYVFLNPTEIDPDKLMTLNWVQAGAAAYFAAFEGDRGEMAMAEWEYFRQTAGSVGDTIGYQYRLAFTSLPPDFTRFPRQRHRYKKRMGFGDVMLRGMVSRMVLSNPRLHPLAEPMEKPAQKSSATYDAAEKQLTVQVDLVRWSPGRYVNYLPKSGKGIFDRRLYARVAVPKGAPEKLGTPQIKVTNGPELVTPTRTHVRHEVWGGVRYLNLQVEAPAGQIRKGTRATFTFPGG